MRRLLDRLLRHVVRWLRRHRYARMDARIRALEVELGMREPTGPSRDELVEAWRVSHAKQAGRVMILEQHATGHARNFFANGDMTLGRDSGFMRPAGAEEYTEWLRAWIAQGGAITHWYEYPFDRAHFLVACSNFTVDSGSEFGARARNILVPAGLYASPGDPNAAFEGWGHTKLYFMPNDSGLVGTNAKHIVGAYSDPEFDFARVTDAHPTTRSSA